ncbi:hypothetical protein F2Q69_00028698 [Brassica cretica]|uniref:Uncharacterized protein n=1 Tax=Brassica cretica TaxID=69181 RepID=A0A8S9S9H9_BRACR|nr:hypothetical protein F2Q69_00028698 [Brassica cretica]
MKPPWSWQRAVTGSVPLLRDYCNKLDMNKIKKLELDITNTVMGLPWKYETRLYPRLYTSPHFHEALASTSRVMTVCVSSSSLRPLIHFFVKCRSRAPFSIQGFVQSWQN